MKKLFFILLCTGLYVWCFADSSLSTSYDGPVKDSYGECIQNSYSDAAADNKDCGNNATTSQQQ